MEMEWQQTEPSFIDRAHFTPKQPFVYTQGIEQQAQWSGLSSTILPPSTAAPVDHDVDDDHSASSLANAVLTVDPLWIGGGKQGTSSGSIWAPPAPLERPAASLGLSLNTASLGQAPLDLASLSPLAVAGGVTVSPLSISTSAHAGTSVSVTPVPSPTNSAGAGTVTGPRPSTSNTSVAGTSTAGASTATAADMVKYITDENGRLQLEVDWYHLFPELRTIRQRKRARLLDLFRAEVKRGSRDDPKDIMARLIKKKGWEELVESAAVSTKSAVKPDSVWALPTIVGSKPHDPVHQPSSSGSSAGGGGSGTSAHGGRSHSSSAGRGGHHSHHQPPMPPPPPPVVTSSSSLSSSNAPYSFSARPPAPPHVSPTARSASGSSFLSASTVTADGNDVSSRAPSGIGHGLDRSVSDASYSSDISTYHNHQQGGHNQSSRRYGADYSRPVSNGGSGLSSGGLSHNGPSSGSRERNATSGDHYHTSHHGHAYRQRSDSYGSSPGSSAGSSSSSDGNRDRSRSRQGRDRQEAHNHGPAYSDHRNHRREDHGSYTSYRRDDQFRSDRRQYQQQQQQQGGVPWHAQQPQQQRDHGPGHGYGRY